MVAGVDKGLHQHLALAVTPLPIAAPNSANGMDKAGASPCARSTSCALGTTPCVGGNPINPRSAKRLSATRALIAFARPCPSRHSSHSHSRRDRALRLSVGSLATTVLRRASTASVNP